MTAYHTCLVLKHEVEIKIPYDVFDRNFRDFRRKHGLTGRFHYSINSDGKFRCELQEEDYSENYLIRITGWRDEGTILIRRIYCSNPLRQYDYVCDFLDLLEVWAVDHKGSFYFEYVDCDEPCMDAYCIRKGLEKTLHFTDAQLQEVLEDWDL